jgi:capsular polysaccharide transport system ATP-binding protein
VLIFKDVSKLHNRKKQHYNLLDINCSFDDQKNVGILAAHERCSTSLLKLISGVEQPTRGSILRDGLFLGPIGDATLLNRDLSAEENIRFICKIYGQNTKNVIHVIKEMSGLNKELRQKVKTYSPSIKRKLAISLTLSMKSDAYQITGPIQHPDTLFNENIEHRLAEIANTSTLFIASENRSILSKFAECSVVIDNLGRLRKFDTLAAGIDAQTALKQAT